MKITSHFVGLEIISEKFIDLFYALQKYLRENNIENILQQELYKISGNITTGNIFLYKVNSGFSPEIQIKINS